MKNRKALIVVTILLIVAVGAILVLRNAKTKTTPSIAIKPHIKLVDSFKVRPLSDVNIERTPERMKKGKYLAEGILMCFTCHSPRNMDSAGLPLIESRKGSGGFLVFKDSTSTIIAPNITSDKETGAGLWTDDMIARAIREGVGHDGRVLSWQMPYNIFRNLSDEDLASVVVYIRSLPAVRNVVRPTKISDEERSWTEKSMRPILEPIPQPDVSDAVKRGSYLVKIGECIGCHTAHSEYNPGIFGGGNFVQRYGKAAFSANITADSSGIAYGVDAFNFVMRTGKGNTLSPAMPWIAFKNMNDEDLAAIYAYLRTLPPSKHYVNNQEPLTVCAICGEKHGAADRNKREKPTGVHLAPELYSRYTGTYQENEQGTTYIILHKGEKLFAKGWNEGPEHEIVPQSELSFIGEGLPLPLNFVKDKNGQITQITEATDWGRTFKKVK